MHAQSYCLASWLLKWEGLSCFTSTQLLIIMLCCTIFVPSVRTTYIILVSYFQTIVIHCSIPCRFVVRVFIYYQYSFIWKYSHIPRRFCSYLLSIFHFIPSLSIRRPHMSFLLYVLSSSITHWCCWTSRAVVNVLGFVNSRFTEQGKVFAQNVYFFVVVYLICSLQVCL